jgi:hypothetical protein
MTEREARVTEPLEAIPRAEPEWIRSLHRLQAEAIRGNVFVSMSHEERFRAALTLGVLRSLCLRESEAQFAHPEERKGELRKIWQALALCDSSRALLVELCEWAESK